MSTRAGETERVDVDHSGANNAPESTTERGRASGFRAKSAPWARPHGLSSVLSSWENDPRVRRNVTLDVTLPARPEMSGPLPSSMHDRVRDALRRRGISTLYAHQLRAFELIADEQDIVVATPTASGKSLCYNLPILDRLARDSHARALYIFPTKALARDQENALRALLKDAELDHGAITYDGDTPGDARKAARERAGLLLTNPDMLHTGILPHHAAWARVFANLQFVVIDEMHTYRGVFGSHFGDVLRRLQRVARFHGSDPRFVFASATIGNPAEHASRLLGREVVSVTESGAPTGPRKVMVYNPPVVNEELGLRASYIKTSVQLTLDLLEAGVSTLLFGQSRNQIETMLKYLRDHATKRRIDPERIQSYRGGYLPETRRRIEEDLREGRLLCVVSTSALELGIDIGGLDAVVCAGYPGTMATLWQRFGRGGRRGSPSLALLVTSSAPVDQYLARTAQQLVSAPIEEARIDPDNVEILLSHLKCAAFELPFAVDPHARSLEIGIPAPGELALGAAPPPQSSFGDVPGDAIADALAYLEEHDLVHASTEPSGVHVYHWTAESYPANSISLRNIGWENFVIVNVQTGHNLGELDWRGAHTMLHEQAIYQHEGEQYQVEKLDFENQKAFVRKVEPDYFTDAMTYTRVSVLEVREAAAYPQAEHYRVNGLKHGMCFGLGDVSVVEKVVGFKKIKFHTHENVGYGDVFLPEIEMQTSAFWLSFGEDLVDAQRVPRAIMIDAIRAAGNALHTVAAIASMIDARDLGLNFYTDDAAAVSAGGSEVQNLPTIILYDAHSGGIGLAPRLFADREMLLRRALDLMNTCSCSDGCPACVGPLVGDDVNPARPQIALKSLSIRLVRDALDLLATYAEAENEGGSHVGASF